MVRTALADVGTYRLTCFPCRLQRLFRKWVDWGLQCPFSPSLWQNDWLGAGSLEVCL